MKRKTVWVVVAVVATIVLVPAAVLARGEPEVVAPEVTTLTEEEMEAKRAAELHEAVEIYAQMWEAERARLDDLFDGVEPMALPVTDEDVTVSWWINFGSTHLARNLGETVMWRELMDRTGVNIEFIHPPVGEAEAAYSLILASGDYPDIITHWGFDYPGGGDLAIEEGVYLRLNDLLEEHAPNYMRALEALDPVRLSLARTAAGNMYAMYGFNTSIEGPWWGPIMRHDWLDEAGLEIPRTIDDWENALTTFRDQRGVQPLLLRDLGWDWAGTFISAFGVGPEFYQDYGVVKFAPIQPGYREYLELMNRWWNEDLLEEDFPAIDTATYNALASTGEVGAWINTTGSLTRFTEANYDHPTFRITGVPYPSLRAGQTVEFRQVNWPGLDTHNKTAITTANQHPEISVQLLDYGFTEDGYFLYNFGVEGLSYNFENGVPFMTEYLTENYYQVLEMYKRHTGMFLRNWAATPPLVTFRPITYHARDVLWMEAGTSMVLPPRTYTPEESRRRGALLTDIQTYVNESVIQFIRGAKPLAEFDSFVEEVQRMGIDELVAIEQAATDRYYAMLE